MDVNACIEWGGGKTSDGYAQKWDPFTKKVKYMHRMVYEQKYGSIENGKTINHLCHNPSCINIDHLECVSQAINNQKRKKMKLSYNQVSEIRDKYSNNRPTYKEIGNIYGVTGRYISLILNKERWQQI